MLPHTSTNGSTSATPTSTTTSAPATAAASQQQQQQLHQLLPLLKHVEAFAKIVNVSQTLQLHEWNVESLKRALQWARFLERGTQQYGTHQQHQLDALLRDAFPAMALPSFAKGDCMTTQALQIASQHLVQALLQSPFLSSHPLRSEMLRFVLHHAAQTTDDNTTDAHEPLDVSAVLADRTIVAQKRAALVPIAHVLSSQCRSIRVQVGHHAVTIRPIQSYLLLPRTLELRAVALSLQANALSAFAFAQVTSSGTQTGSLDATTTTPPNAFASFLTTFSEQLRAATTASSTSNDVLEVTALLVAALEWPQPTADVRNALCTRVLEPVLVTNDLLLQHLAPWLCALLAAHSPAVRQAYIAALLRNGLVASSRAASSFRERIATLVHQSQATAADVLAALATIDPLVLQQLLGDGR